MWKSAIAALVVTLGASSVFAAETQPYDPSVKLFAYEKQVDNFCPSGTQPVRYNGIISCGIPNATGYGEAPVVRRSPAPTAQAAGPKSPIYQPDTIYMSGN